MNLYDRKTYNEVTCYIITRSPWAVVLSWQDSCKQDDL